MPYLLINNHNIQTPIARITPPTPTFIFGKKDSGGQLINQEDFFSFVCSPECKLLYKDEGVDSFKQFNEYCKNPKADFGSVEDKAVVDIYNKLLTSILGPSWKDLFSLEGMILEVVEFAKLTVGAEHDRQTKNAIAPKYQNNNEDSKDKKTLKIQLIGNGS